MGGTQAECPPLGQPEAATVAAARPEHTDLTAAGTERRLHADEMPIEG